MRGTWVNNFKMLTGATASLQNVNIIDEGEIPTQIIFVPNTDNAILAVPITSYNLSLIGKLENRF